MLTWIQILSVIWLLQWEYVTFSRGQLIPQEESSGEQHCDCPYPRGINLRRMIQLSLLKSKRYFLGIFLSKEHWKKPIFCSLINLVPSACSDPHKCETWNTNFQVVSIFHLFFSIALWIWVSLSLNVTLFFRCRIYRFSFFLLMPCSPQVWAAFCCHALLQCHPLYSLLWDFYSHDLLIP